MAKKKEDNESNEELIRVATNGDVTVWYDIPNRRYFITATINGKHKIFVEEK